MIVTRAQRQLLWQIADGKLRIDHGHGWQAKTVDALIRRGLLDEGCQLTAAGQRELGLDKK